MAGLVLQGGVVMGVNQRERLHLCIDTCRQFAAAQSILRDFVYGKTMYQPPFDHSSLPLIVSVAFVSGEVHWKVAPEEGMKWARICTETTDRATP